MAFIVLLPFFLTKRIQSSAAVGSERAASPSVAGRMCPSTREPLETTFSQADVGIPGMRLFSRSPLLLHPHPTPPLPPVTHLSRPPSLLDLVPVLHRFPLSSRSFL